MEASFVISLMLFTVVISTDQYSHEDSCIDIKVRSKWEARAPTTVHYQSFPVENVIIHHTASTACSTFRSCATQIKNIQHYHQTAKKWPDIAYNFLIGNDGNVYEGVGWHKIGRHTHGFNNGSIAIAFIGNFNDVLPSKEALQAAKNLMECGVNTRELQSNYLMYGARQLKNTDSPGLTLFAEIQDWDNWAETPVNH